MNVNEIILPIVHLNGTSPDSLIEEREVAFRGLYDAYAAMRQMAPNGRDYYPEPGLLERAIEQHDRRLRAIHDLQSELEYEVKMIQANRGRR